MRSCACKVDLGLAIAKNKKHLQPFSDSFSGKSIVAVFRSSLPFIRLEMPRKSVAKKALPGKQRREWAAFAKQDSQESWREWLAEALATAGASKAHRITKPKDISCKPGSQELVTNIEEQQQLWQGLWGNKTRTTGSSCCRT